MIIYKRTIAGNEVAHDRESLLPRKLRTLLIAVDGKTSISTYVNTLSSFGDVESLLQSLEASGLIEPVGVASASGFSGTVVRESQTKVFRDNSNSAPPKPLVSFEQAQASFNAFKPANDKNASKNTPNHFALHQVIGLMSDFVTQHLPSDSLEIILSLDGLRSIDDVKANKDGYISLVKHLGEPAKRHLEILNSALDIYS